MATLSGQLVNSPSVPFGLVVSACDPAGVTELVEGLHGELRRRVVTAQEVVQQLWVVTWH